MSKEVLGREGWEGGGEAVGGARGGGGRWRVVAVGKRTRWAEEGVRLVMRVYLTISASAITGVADLVQYV